MASATSTELILTLKSADGELFHVPASVAAQSTIIRDLIIEDCASGIIPICNVGGKILSMVIKYCVKHAQAIDEEGAEALKSWDEEFVKVDWATLFDLILAAQYLDIKPLFDLTFVTGIAEARTAKETRKILAIRNDHFPPEYEEFCRVFE